MPWLTESSGAGTDTTLKAGAIGFVDALVIGLASTSPAYSLAAIIGPVVALVGVYAPGVLIASFVPMLLIAFGGWAITMTGVLVIGALADVAVLFSLLTVGLDPRRSRCQPALGAARVGQRSVCCA